MGSRILIVDDEQPVRTLLTITFSRAGFDVQSAGNVPEAMALCTAEPFDFVLSDVRMPGLSGHDLVKWLAAEHPGTPTAMMSGCDLECDNCPFTAQCARLPKPFLPGEALSLIQRMISRGLNALTDIG